nr:hypothetical protein [Paenibacillus sp. SYP-B3998]
MLITARLKSSRLPLKLLAYIQGKRVIDHVVERCKAVSLVDQVILCTSPNPQDAPLVNAAYDHHIHYFLGDPDDVLKRLYDAACFYRLDYILSITADDLFFSVEYANRFANQALLTKPDYMYTEGLPLGVGIYGISYEALKSVIEFKNRTDTEIWGYWFNHPDLFRIHTFQARKEESRKVRLTLDTEEDLAFFQKIEPLLRPEDGMSYPALLRAIDKLPEEAFVNQHIVQLNLPSEAIEAIKSHYQQERNQFLRIKAANDKR